MTDLTDFSVRTGREYARMDLLLRERPNLRELERLLESGILFCGVYRGERIALCLVERKSQGYEIVDWVADPAWRGRGYGKALLFYVFDYLKALGAGSVELARSNADLDAFSRLQRLGFRVAGVRDGGSFGNTPAIPENGIPRRDQVRYRFTL